jgi:outer membrane immunogenic protein
MFKAKLFAAACCAAALCAGAAGAQTAGAYDWTGPYVGLHAGGIDGETKFDRTTGFLSNNTNALQTGLRPTADTAKDRGFTGGGQVGYNFATGGGLVLGVEADIAYTDVKKTDVLSNTTNFGPLGVPSATPFTRVNQYRGELDYLGTVRGRLGWAFDRLLVYGTGGLAYGHVKQEVTFFGPNAPTTPFFQGDENGAKTGWAYGGGVEYAAPTDSMFNVFNASAVTLRAEYMHYDLGRDTLTFPGVNGGSEIGGYNARVRTDGDLVRLGVNYKF